MRRHFFIGLASLILIPAGSAIAWPFAPGKVPTSKLAGPYRVEVHERGRLAFERRLEPGSGEEQAVARWIEAHRSGWGCTVVTYVHGRRIIGDRFALNFVGDLAVLNYESGPGKRSIQVRRTIRKDEIPSVFGKAE